MLPPPLTDRPRLAFPPQAEYSYGDHELYNVTSYDVDVRFLDTTDEDFTGHIRTTSYTFYNTLPYSDVTYTVSPYSDDYVTDEGGTMQLFLYLNRAPSEGTVVEFSVATSNPARAFVVYGDLLVFTPENWDIGIPVLVQGAYYPSNVTIGSCESTCFGQDCDGWDDYGGTDNSTCDLYGDDLTIEYGCDCKGCACQQAPYTGNSSAGWFNVDVRFLSTNDEDFSGHTRTTQWPFENRRAYSELAYVVSPHSDDFTTTHGGTVQLFVSLTRAPSEGTFVRFTVSTSDPATAFIEYGDTLVFTPRNWDIGIPVLVRGVYQSNYTNTSAGACGCENGTNFCDYLEDGNATGSCVSCDEVETAGDCWLRFNSRDMGDRMYTRSLHAAAVGENVDSWGAKDCVDRCFSSRYQANPRGQVDVLTDGEIVSYPRDAASYAREYNVDVRFQDTTDEDFSGHVRTTRWPFVNTVPYSDLSYVVSPHSNDFTTTHGGTVQLFVSLTRAPSEDTTVRFSVSTSDPATAYVEYGDLLVFTPENWDMGIPVLVRGVYQVGRARAAGAE